VSAYLSVSHRSDIKLETTDRRVGLVWFGETFGEILHPRYPLPTCKKHDASQYGSPLLDSEELNQLGAQP
jgi:hypothetical protein